MHNEKGQLFLDELDPNYGRMDEEIMEDCSIFCSIVADELTEGQKNR